jgi:hypothetical protein
MGAFPSNFGTTMDMVDMRGVGTEIVGLTTACSKCSKQQLLRIVQDAKRKHNVGGC